MSEGQVQEVWDPDAWMAGGVKTRSAKFGAVKEGQSPVPGSVEGGIILDKKMVQQKVYNPADPSVHGKPKVYENSGKPMLQMIVRVQTNKRDDDEDDGTRAIFVKGQMKAVIQEAVAKAGAPRLEEGGILKVRFIEQVFEKGFKKNIFEAKYERPANREADEWMDSKPAADPVDKAKVDAVVHESRSTLRAIQESGHSASLRPSNGFDDSEPPF